MGKSFRRRLRTPLSRGRIETVDGTSGRKREKRRVQTLRPIDRIRKTGVPGMTIVLFVQTLDGVTRQLGMSDLV